MRIGIASGGSQFSLFSGEVLECNTKSVLLGTILTKGEFKKYLIIGCFKELLTSSAAPFFISGYSIIVYGGIELLISPA